LLVINNRFFYYFLLNLVLFALHFQLIWRTSLIDSTFLAVSSWADTNLYTLLRLFLCFLILFSLKTIVRILRMHIFFVDILHRLFFYPRIKHLFFLAISWNGWVVLRNIHIDSTVQVESVCLLRTVSVGLEEWSKGGGVWHCEGWRLRTFEDCAEWNVFVFHLKNNELIKNV